VGGLVLNLGLLEAYSAWWGVR